jgi:hypothetical protein
MIPELEHLCVLELDPLDHLLEALPAPGFTATEVDSSDWLGPLKAAFRDTGRRFFEIALIPGHDDGPHFIASHSNR